MPGTEARFPTLEEATAAVDELRRTYPDIPALATCDQERLLGALYQPVQSVEGRDAYPTLTLKLAVLVCGIVKCHACWTGAKRIGLAILLTALRLNGCWLQAEDVDLADLVEDIAARVVEPGTDGWHLLVDETDAWMGEHVSCVPAFAFAG